MFIYSKNDTVRKIQNQERFARVSLTYSDTDCHVLWPAVCVEGLCCNILFTAIFRRSMCNFTVKLRKMMYFNMAQQYLT